MKSSRAGRFTGPFARRLYVLIVLLSLLPLTLMAMISLGLVRDASLRQDEKRLAADANRYGTILFDRLRLARDVAALAQAMPQAIAGAGSETPVGQMFASLAIVATDGTTNVLLGQTRGLAPLLDKALKAPEGKTLVHVERDSPPRIGLAFKAGERTVMGELKPAYLWGSMELRPPATNFCVIETGSRQVLFCSAPDGPMAVRALDSVSGETSQAIARWSRDGENFRAAAWRQPLGPAIDTPDWIILAAKPEDVARSAANDVLQFYVPLAVLTLLLAVWLAIRQARSALEPVSRIAQSARAMTRHDFSTRVNLLRRDEFGELGLAFDLMASRLGRQITSLTALSEVDSMILADSDMDAVIRKVLEHLGKAVPANALAIVLFDRENPDRANTYLHSAESPDMSVVKTQAGSNDNERIKAASGDGTILDAAMLWPASLAPLRVAGSNFGLLLPITWRDTLCGVIAMGFPEVFALGEDEREQTREFADRVAIVVSSAWRDEQLFLQAHYDQLTGLPNRLLFQDRIAQEIARCQRNQERFALLFIDLDNFKTVNDAYGHSVGDLILHEASRRIVASVRRSDTVSRLGGDEFTVILTDLNHPSEANRIADEIIKELSEEFLIAGMSSFLSASIGIACYPEDGPTTEDLLKNADTAMYRAKSAGRARAVYFEKLMNTDSRARLALERDLRLAIERGEMELHYQPQLDIKTGAIRAAEGLVRWRHPTQGMIPPGRFIPLAESTGLIVPLGEWVLREGCRQMKAWRVAGINLEQIAVNASPRQFRNRDFVDLVRGCVRDTGLPPGFLEIEITEGLLLDNSATIHEMLGELASEGVLIALDDFGTGFSSMAYLTRFPVDVIKIDRAFVDGLGKSADAAAIVEAILVLSRALGKRVVAEGVETAEQLDRLRVLGCDLIQGYFLSPGLPAAKFEEFFRRHKPLVSAAGQPHT